MLTHRESQPQAIHLTGQSRIDPVEVLKDTFQVLLRDAESIVTHTDFQERWRVVGLIRHAGRSSLRSWPRNHINAASRRGIVDGIVQQVVKHLAQAPGIAFDWGDFLCLVPEPIPALQMKREAISAISSKRSVSTSRRLPACWIIWRNSCCSSGESCWLRFRSVDVYPLITVGVVRNS